MQENLDYMLPIQFKFFHLQIGVISPIPVPSLLLLRSPALRRFVRDAGGGGRLRQVPRVHVADHAARAPAAAEGHHAATADEACRSRVFNWGIS